MVYANNYFCTGSVILSICVGYFLKCDAFQGNDRPYLAKKDSIFSAAEFGNVSRIRELIAQGIDINQYDTEGETPLIKAIINGQLVAVKLLIESGATINKRARYGTFTPLFFAVMYGHRALTQLLISAGASVNPGVYPTWTCLHKAVESGDVQMVQDLLQAGLPINHQDFYGWTALHCAAERGYAKIARILINSGADINVKTIFGQMAAHLARIHGYRRLAQFIEETPERFRKALQRTRMSALILVQALHPRIGQSSPLFLLDQHVIKEIVQLLLQAEKNT